MALFAKATERLVRAGKGIAFPLGTLDTFTTYSGPARLPGAANIGPVDFGEIDEADGTGDAALKE